MRDGAAVIRVRPPVDGQANEALCRFIGKRAGVAPSRVRVASRHSWREKIVEVEGLETAQLRAALCLPV